MWQYSSSGKINGISGNVDCDYCYVDYPATIKNGCFNGYKKQNTKPTAAPDTPAKNEKSPTTEITYSVVKGDTLSDIASRYGTTVLKLVKDNNIKNADLIYVGQKIKIIK